MKKILSIAVLVIACCQLASAQLQVEAGLGSEYNSSGLMDAGYGFARASVAWCFNNDRAVSLDLTRDRSDITLGAFVCRSDQFSFDPARSVNSFGGFLRLTIGGEHWKFGVEDSVEFAAYRCERSPHTWQMSCYFQPCVQYDVNDRLGLLLSLCPLGFWSPDLSKDHVPYAVWSKEEERFVDPALSVLPDVWWFAAARLSVIISLAK